MAENESPEAAGKETASDDAGVDTPMHVDSVEDIAGFMAAVTSDEQEESAPEQAPDASDAPDESDADAADPTDETDTDGETEADVEEETDGPDETAKAIRDLPEEVQKQVQSIIDRRIGQVVKQRKTLETELELAESRARRAEEAQQELETKLADTSSVPVNAQVDPLMLSDESKVDEYDWHLAKLEALAIENWDGYEDDQGNSWSAQDVRKQYQAIREQRERLVPKARETARKRTEFEQAARQIHPELFDRKTQEHKAISAYMKHYPQLRVVPNIHMILGDAIKYERLRLEQAKNGKKKAEPMKKAVPPRPPASSNPPPPRPSGQAPTLADFSRVAETGGNDPDAIAAAVASLS
jgi:hypothetical protein